jgi:hypothetical protein
VAPALDFQISREGLTLNCLEPHTASEIPLAKMNNSDLLLVRGWIEEKKAPPADGIAKLIPRFKKFAQLLDQIHLQENVLVISSKE